MAQSPEFPELKFVRPRSWHAGRARPGQPTIIVIHDTEGSEGRTSAEDGAAYDARRTDGTSTHFFVDADTVVQCVLTKDTANHAKSEGNIRGIGFELCGRASQTQAQWLDGGLDLALAAKYVAKCCRKWGIPARRLTVAQLRAGEKGICAHADVTAAWHQSTHTDPGPNFPWSQFLDMVQQQLEEEDMPTAQEIAKAVWDELVNWRGTGQQGLAQQVRAGTGIWYAQADAYRAWQHAQAAEAKVDAIATQLGVDLTAVRQRLEQLADLDEAAVAQQILATLTPQAIAAAVPAELARQVADELAARLAD